MWTEEHRRIYRREGDGNPSGLRDAEWVRLEPLIPKASPGGRQRKTDMRSAMNAILYLLRGSPSVGRGLERGGEGTFAGTRRNGEVAPVAVVHPRHGLLAVLG